MPVTSSHRHHSLQQQAAAVDTSTWDELQSGFWNKTDERNTNVVLSKVVQAIRDCPPIYWALLPSLEFSKS